MSLCNYDTFSEKSYLLPFEKLTVILGKWYFDLNVVKLID